MADRPINATAREVRALLDGRKTQTRRVMNPQPVPCLSWGDPPAGSYPSKNGWSRLRYAVGDRLWVRETYYQRGHWVAVAGAVTRKGKRQKWRFVPADDVLQFDAPAEFRKGRHSADPGTIAWHRRLARFMPCWASRLTLTVTEVRVQRLQDITATDARSEGVFVPEAQYAQQGHRAPILAYAALWEDINGPGAWDLNPWVAATTFTVEIRNIDANARTDP